MYYGASYAGDLPTWEQELGNRLSVHRTFFQSYQVDKLVAAAADDKLYRRLPHVSSKPPGPWKEVADGLHDAWLHDVANRLNQQQSPVFFTLHHEPEDDSENTGMLPLDFVRMTRRTIRIFGNRAPKVTVIPVLMSWTFDPRSGRNTAEWIVDDAAVLGIDAYNPWSPTNGVRWETLQSLVDPMKPYAAGRPIAVAEYGCHTDPAQPGRAAQWMRDAYSYAKNNNVVSLSYFNYWLPPEDDGWELDEERGAIFKARLGYQAVARL